MDDRWAAEVRGQQKPSNDPRNNQHNLGTPTTGHRSRTNGIRRNQHSSGTPTTDDGAPRTRKRHQQEHPPQRPTERSGPTQHAKGRTGDCPGPRK